MKKLLFAGACAAALMGAPAAAQTGTINITGTVAARCAIVGGSSGSTFTDNVNLGELAKSDGTLETSGTLTARFTSTTTSGTPAFRVVCDSANPSVAVDATELTTPGAPPTGYNNRIDYVARVNVTTAGGGNVLVSNATTGAATAPTPLGAPISGAPGNNISVNADTFSTPTPGALLVAGTYTGNILVTVTPS